MSHRSGTRVSSVIYMTVVVIPLNEAVMLTVDLMSSNIQMKSTRCLRWWAENQTVHRFLVNRLPAVHYVCSFKLVFANLQMLPDEVQQNKKNPVCTYKPIQTATFDQRQLSYSIICFQLAVTVVSSIHVLHTFHSHHSKSPLC